MSLKKELTNPSVEKFIYHYETFYSIVFSSVYTKINNYHDAEDICQEVFIRFYDKIDEIETPRKWLFGCLRIVVFEFYKRKYSKEVNIEEIFDDIGIGYVNGFRDTRIMIKEILESIQENEDAEDIVLFELIAVYNYSFADAARHQGFNYKQARYRFSRIVSKITDELKKRGIKSIEELL